MFRGAARAKAVAETKRVGQIGRSVCTVEAMEPRILMAAAKARGGSGYSGTLSTNPALRQMQLSCDPDEPIEGSTSVTYDTSKVSLFGYGFGPGYGPEIIIGSNGGGIAAGSGDGYVGVRQIIIIRGQIIRRTILQEINSFLQQPAGAEVGYVQFRYTRNSADVGTYPPAQGFSIVDVGGVDGVDTHAIFFRYKDGVPSNANATFKVFAAPANFVGGNPADYLIANDAAHTRIDVPDLTSATVSTVGLTTYVSGSAWGSGFKSYLSRSLQGSSSLGYRVADASFDADSGVLPWVNLDTISFSLSQPLPSGAFDSAHVSVIGPDGQPRVVQFFSYDPNAQTATIRLKGSLPAGQTRVSLDLDTLAGVDRTIFLNVSPGDVNRSGGSVNATDLVLTRNRVGQIAPIPPIIKRPFSAFVDVDGSGAINATDLVLVRNRIGVSIPGLSAIVSPFSDFAIDRSSKKLDELQ